MKLELLYIWNWHTLQDVSSVAQAFDQFFLVAQPFDQFFLVARLFDQEKLVARLCDHGIDEN